MSFFPFVIFCVSVYHWDNNDLIKAVIFLARAYRCPLCMHSAWEMGTHWEHIDKEIALSPMPTEYQDATVKVSTHLFCQLRLGSKWL